MATYYYGWEALCEYGVEDPDFYSRPVPSANFNGLSHLKTANITVNENAQWNMDIGQANFRKPSSTHKLGHEPIVTLNFALPDDLDSTALDVWILKLALDAYNVAHDGTKWVIPNTGSSVYGSNDLASFNVELGHNKSGNIRAHHVLGCLAEELTITMDGPGPVMFALRAQGKIAYMNQSSFTNGSATRSTAKELTRANCQVEYGNDGSASLRNDITGLTMSFLNQLTRNYDLADSLFIINDCEATTGWSDSTDATLATSTTAVKQGSNSLSFAKDGTSSTEFSSTLTTNAVDLANKKAYLWVYIADASTLTALDVSAAANNHVLLGTGGVTNYNQYNMGTGLAVGWNLIQLDVDSPDTTGGDGADETLIDRVKVKFQTDNTSDTIAANKVLVDHIHTLTPRSCSNFILGRQNLSGSFTVNLTTTSGMELFQELAGDSGDPIEPTDTSTLKELLFRLRNLSNPSTQKIEFDLRNVTVGQIPADINPEVVTEIQVPYEAQYYALNIFTPDTSAPTNWNDQS